MTVRDNDACISLQNNSTLEYQFDFDFSDISAIHVYVTDSTGFEKELNNPADYSIINIAKTGLYNTSGTILLKDNTYTGTDALTSIKIARIVSISQGFAFSHASALDTTLAEYSFDYGVMIDQQLECEINKLSSVLAYVPNPKNQPDNQIIVTDSGNFVFQHKDDANSLLPPQQNHPGEYLHTDGNNNLSWEKVDALPTQSGNTGKVLTTDGTNTSWKDCYCPPNPAGNAGKYLTTDGTDVSWANVDALPDQTGNAGEYLTTDGTNTSWAKVDALPTQSGNTGKYLTTDGTNTSWAKVDALPDQTSNSGKVLTTDGTDASWKDCYCPPDPTTEGDGRILETKNGHLIYVDAASATNPLPPLTSNADKHLTVKTDETGVEWSDCYCPPDPTSESDGRILETKNGSLIYQDKDSANSLLPPQATHAGDYLHTDGAGNLSWESVETLPDQTGNVGKHLVTDGTNTSWADQRVPDPSTATDGQILVKGNGKWESKDNPNILSDDQQIEDSSGLLTGYTLTNNGGNSMDTSAFSVRFLVGGKRVVKDFTAKSYPKPANDGLYWLVAHSDGSITYETIRPPIDDGGILTLGTVRVVGSAIIDHETSATNLKGNADQIKYLSGLIGGKMFNGYLDDDGTDSFYINSIVAGSVDIWRYGINSTSLGQYNLSKWTFTNPINHKIIDKDGTATQARQNIIFNTVFYYDDTGNAQVLGNQKRTIALVYILPDKLNTLYVTYGFGEYDSNDVVPDINSLLLSRRALIAAELTLYGICIGAIEYVKGKDLSQNEGSFVIPYGGASSGASTGGGASTGVKRSFDVSNGLLGTCQISILPSGSSVSATFTGEAVFCDDSTSTVTKITPQDNPQIDIVDIATADTSYIILQSNGVAVATPVWQEGPRENTILLAVVDHTDRTRITRVYELYVSSDVDAHRIKDIWRSYRPLLRGCIPKVTTTIDAQSNTEYGFAISAGTFLNYTADPSKRYNNHIIDITAKPRLTPFLFRSIEPKDYADGWVKSDTSAMNTLLKVPKIIDKQGVVKDLSNDHVTVYIGFINSKGDIVLIVPDLEYALKNVAYFDGDTILRDFETKIDYSVLEQFAIFGYFIALKDSSGTVTWDVVGGETAIKDRIFNIEGNFNMKLNDTKRPQSLVEHVNGNLREYDPTTYTFGFYGDMDNYPDVLLRDLTRGYRVNATADDSASDGTARQYSFGDAFTNIVVDGSNSPPAGGYTYTLGLDLFRMKPSPEHLHSIPVTYVLRYYDTGNYYTRIGYSEIYNPNITVKEKIVWEFVGGWSDISGTSSGIFIAFSQKVNNSYSGTFNALNLPTGWSVSAQSNGGINFTYAGTHGSPDGLKVELDRTITRGNKYEVGVYLYSENTSYLLRSGDINVTRTLEDLNTSLPRDHLRFNYGTLATLNTSSTSSPLLKGTITNNIVPGDIAIFVNFTPASGTTWQTGSKWNAFAKNSIVMGLLPSVTLISSSGDEVAAHISRILNWHAAIYVIKGVTQDMIDNYTITLRIKNTANTSFITQMHTYVGACMVGDAF